MDDAEHLSEFEEKTGFSHRGWRFLYTIIAGVFSGMELRAGHSYFIELGLYVAPLCLDYLRYRYHQKWRTIINYGQRGVMIAFLLGAIFGAARIFNVVDLHHILVIAVAPRYPIGGRVRIPLKTVWLVIVGIAIALTGIDATYTLTKQEAATLDAIKRTLGTS